jgi:predicted RNase H-like nuclease (RuvC/YqgF family)
LQPAATAGKEPMETDKDPDQKLQDCEEKLKQLEEENRHLRDASDAFGQLAERLNITLQEERRRTGNERRQWPRPEPDRRQRALAFPGNNPQEHD